VFQLPLTGRRRPLVVVVVRRAILLSPVWFCIARSGVRPAGACAGVRRAAGAHAIFRSLVFVLCVLVTLSALRGAAPTHGRWVAHMDTLISKKKKKKKKKNFRV